MGQDVSWMLELSVAPERGPEFQTLMKEMISATETNEAGALNYEWSLSDDGGTCHIFERYVSSDAAMAHLATFGATFASRFLELLKPVRFMVYGAPNQEVKQALAAFAPSYMVSVGGFSR